MKRSVITIAIAGLAFTACKKGSLDLLPDGSVTTRIYYKSVADFQLAVNGAYVPMREIADLAFFVDEMRSDNTHYEYNQKDRGGLGYEQLADFMDDSQNGVTGGRWGAAYKGIARCNTILSRLQTIDFPMTDSIKNLITGEAKALRAHYYFDLVRHFGQVPLVLVELLDESQFGYPRAAVNDVYAQIITDFKDALALLPAPKVPGSSRMNKGVVSSELALVYMTLKQWDKAIPLLEDVANTMGYDLVTNYRDIFNPSNKLNKEAIFEVQYKQGNEGHQSNFIYRFIPVMPTDGTEKMIGIKYNNANGGWNIPTEDLIRQYEQNDKRLPASIAIVEGKLNINDEFIADSVITRDVRTYTTPAGSVSQRFIRKYFYPPYTTPGYNTGQNWPLFRLGGVLLMLAESYNEASRSGDALAPLNRVRDRAGLLPVSNTDQTQLREIIMKEQRLELAFENYRWLDLVRTGNAASVMTAHGLEMKSKYTYLPANAYNVTPKKYVYPVPFREMQLNPTWIQNDY